jgi:iron-sulfur cluster repair protein YtfE (RIC family)
MIYHVRKLLRKRKNSFYQEKLIKKLNDEHQLLINLALSLEEAAKKDDIQTLKKLLDKFQKELELHLLYEDTNLYEYLHWKFYFFEDIRKAIEKKHQEMSNIAVAVQDFITYYKENNDTKNFLNDFEGIKEILVKRIEFEENVLYDIYDSFYKWQEVLAKFKKYEEEKEDY